MNLLVQWGRPIGRPNSFFNLTFWVVLNRKFSAAMTLGSCCWLENAVIQKGKLLNTLSRSICDRFHNHPGLIDASRSGLIERTSGFSWRKPTILSVVWLSKVLNEKPLNSSS